MKPISRLHRSAATVGTGLIAVFWTLSLGAEWLGDLDTLRTVKAAIAYTMPLLVVALAAAALSGHRWSGHRWSGHRWSGGVRHPTILAKKRAASVMAAIGLGILAPCAIVLHLLAQKPLTSTFWALQMVELCAGAVNFSIAVWLARAGASLSRRTG
ncbi:MAG: hypothetical protein AAFV53_31535 [Myxococcota bacterium]